MEGMNFGPIKKAVEHNDKLVEGYERGGDLMWRHYNTPLEDFGSTFSKVVPAEYIDPINKKLVAEVEEYGNAFKQYVEDTVSKSKNPDHYAIEFGGPGSKMFQGFTENTFTKTAGVCLDDPRNDDWEVDDMVNNHAVMEGDILHPEKTRMYETLNRYFKGKKVDFVVSRMMKPTESLEKHPVIMDRLIQEWYKLLNENGLLFAQFDYFKEHNPHMMSRLEDEISPPGKRQSERDVALWVEKIRERFPTELDIQVGRGVIRIHKKEGAPEELPSMKELFAA